MYNEINNQIYSLKEKIRIKEKLENLRSIAEAELEKKLLSRDELLKQLNNNLILLLDNKIIKFNIDTYEQEQIKEFDSSQILFVSLLDNYYVSIEKYLDNTNKYNIITKDYNNVDISSIDIENAPRFVVNSKNLNYCIFQNSLKVVNKWGIEVLSKEFVSVPKDIIIFNNNKSAALIYTNKIQIINL